MLSAMTPLEEARVYEVRESADIPAADRPRFHLTPRIGWMNDPNGFCWYRGEYHLFYQYHPYDTRWGPMHWGHAASTDLLHWDYRPCALAPDTGADGMGCFSGSAVPLDDGRLLLLYTGVSGTKEDPVQAQCAALGDGVNFVKCPRNPVILPDRQPEGFCAADFRDPKIWREDGRFYCVVSGRHRKDLGSIQLYESLDGLHWQFVTVLDASRDKYGRMWECPDFFPLDGRRVLLVSPQEMAAGEDPELRPGYAALALVGDYDPQSRRFARQGVQLLDHGIDFYAPQTTLTPDGRRVMVAWMQSWETCGEEQHHRHKWFGRMTLPRELFVRDGRLCQRPVKELETLWRQEVRLAPRTAQGEIPLPGFGGRYLDLSLTLDTAASPDCRALALRFAQGERHYTQLRWDAARGELVFDRTRSGTRRDIPHVRRLPAVPRDGKLSLRLILDGESAELFVNDGERALTALLTTPLTEDGLSLYSEGPARVELVQHHLL